MDCGFGIYLRNLYQTQYHKDFLLLSTGNFEKFSYRFVKLNLRACSDGIGSEERFSLYMFLEYLLIKLKA